jgi:hypothetical protein
LNATSAQSHPARVARWFVFKPKNLNLGKFGGLRIENVGIHIL